jgi:hypothetical protein
MNNVVKFPFARARGAWSRMPRRSKNGTPEERAAKVTQEMTSPPADLAFIGNAKPPAMSDAEFRGALAGLDEMDRQYMTGYIQGIIDARALR